MFEEMTKDDWEVFDIIFPGAKEYLKFKCNMNELNILLSQDKLSTFEKQRKQQLISELFNKDIECMR